MLQGIFTSLKGSSVNWTVKSGREEFRKITIIRIVKNCGRSSLREMVFLVIKL